MTYSQIIVLGIEMIGTIAFASSGAMVGIKKNMDIFGVVVLAITTAVGGGMIRDLILGIHPPMVFRNGIYVGVSIVTACLLFVVVFMNRKVLSSRFMEQYERVMMIMDAIGLGAFTVIGINTALGVSKETSVFLLIFVGAVTGIGGGMLRDIMAGMTPYVFVKHVYASASIVGAVVCIFLRLFMSDGNAMIIGAFAVILLRYLAAHYKWNLPRINP